jgi:hypothetical protein
MNLKAVGGGVEVGCGFYGLTQIPGLWPAIDALPEEYKVLGKVVAAAYLMVNAYLIRDGISDWGKD